MDQNQTDNAHKKCEVIALSHSYKDALPDVVMKEISHILHLAAHVYKEGDEMPMVFVAMTAEGNSHLIDPSGLPIKPMIAMMVKRQLDALDAVAVISINEGWSLSDDEARKWVEGGKSGQLKDHPEAFEVFGCIVETLNGTWIASAKVSPQIEGQPRTVEHLEFSKVEAARGTFNNLLKQNRPEGEVEDPILSMIVGLMGGRFSKTDEDGNEILDEPAVETPADKSV